MDKIASQEVNNWIRTNKNEYPSETVDNHCTNADEQCIKTENYHLITGLATTDLEFPITQWNKLILQVQ